MGNPVITVENYECSLEGISKQAYSAIRGHLRVPNDYFTRESSGWNMPEYSYFIKRDKKTGKLFFLTGLVERVYAILLSFYEEDEIKIIDNRVNTEPLPKSYIISTIKSLPIYDTIRDYQLDAILEGINRPTGIFHMATGSGKTAILAGMIGVYGKKTLVIVNKTDLADQLVDEISFYNGIKKRDIGKMYGGRYSDKEIVVGLSQTLMRAGTKSKKSRKIKDYLESVEMVIVDECHNAHSSSFKKILKMCKNAGVKYGFSATPFNNIITPAFNDGDYWRKGDPVVDIFTLEGLFGPVIARKTTRDLINDGWLAEPTIMIVKNQVYSDGEMLAWADEYDRIIVKDEKRNKMICDIVAKHYRDGQQVIGFVSRIQHGENLAEMLVNEYGINPDDFGFVSGDSSLPYDMRKKMISDFKEGGLRVMFGTVLSEGLNFQPEVGINISGGKKSSVVIQRVGRILRKPRDPKTGDVNPNAKRNVKFYDFSDEGNFVFTKHANNRISTYEQQGHNVVMLKDGDYTS